MNQKSIILFDGVCSLCNASIDFILKRDHKNLFLVGALQSEEGKKLKETHQIPEEYFDSLILIEKGQVYFKSTGALKIAKNLSGLWPLFYPLIFLPERMRDLIYDWIGKNRYRWFGRKETCRLPTPEEKEKFLA